MKRNDIYLSPGRGPSPDELDVMDKGCEVCGFHGSCYCEKHNFVYCEDCACPMCEEEER